MSYSSGVHCGKKIQGPCHVDIIIPQRMTDGFTDSFQRRKVQYARYGFTLLRAFRKRRFKIPISRTSPRTNGTSAPVIFQRAPMPIDCCLKNHQAPAPCDQHPADILKYAHLYSRHRQSQISFSSFSQGRIPFCRLIRHQQSHAAGGASETDKHARGGPTASQYLCPPSASAESMPRTM